MGNSVVVCVGVGEGVVGFLMSQALFVGCVGCVLPSAFVGFVVLACLVSVKSLYLRCPRFAE